jgi:nitrate/nitrite transport system ATP-binding protein
LPLIDISRVSKTFHPAAGPSRHVLQGISLSIERGEFVSIVGFTGCGKSTLLKIAAGLLAPDAGEVRVNGDLVQDVPQEAALVFQNYSLLPWFSALENVRLAVQASAPGLSRDGQHVRARRYLELVGLGNALSRRPGQLSGGMRQRVAIARAFATEPAILYLDEPFGALDALTRGALQQELAALCSAAARPVTTLMITNNIEEALLLSDRIIPMTRGPRATLESPIPIDLPRPRTASQLLHDDAAAHLRAQVVSCLAGRSHEPRPAAPAVQPEAWRHSLEASGES